MDGVLLIDKPQGISSHDVVRRVRKILQQKKVGHAVWEKRMRKKYAADPFENTAYSPWEKDGGHPFSGNSSE